MSSMRPPLSSRPTFLPDEISRREFATVFRGYDPAEVRTFLNQLAEQAGEMGDRIAEIQKSLLDTEEKVKNPELTEEMVTSLLGEQTAQILRSAREAAGETRRKADEEVGRQLRDAHEVTAKMREEAETLLAERTEEAERMGENVRADAARYAEETTSAANEEAARVRKELAAEKERREAELEADILRRREQADREITDVKTKARQESRELIDAARAEAQTLVARTQERQTELIEGLVRKRKIALAQLESLRAGRHRLLESYKLVRTTLDEVTAELLKVEDEARNAGSDAGQRALAASDIEADEIDTDVEMEQFEVESDVSNRILDLINEPESGGEEEPEEDEGEPTEVVNIIEAGDKRAPFDFDAQDDEEDVRIVNLTVVEDAEDEPQGDPAQGNGGPLQSSPMSTLTLEATEKQQALNLVDDDSDEDEPRTAQISMIIGESYAGDAAGEMGHALKLRRDAVVSKARSQSTRRLKRALQDEQDGVIARLRQGEAKSIQALLGSADDQAAAYHRAVVKLLREVARTGASSVPGSTGVERGVIDRTGTAAARNLADQLVGDLRERLVPILEAELARDETSGIETLTARVSEPYRYIKGDYLERLVDERVGQIFDQGVGFASR